MTYLSSAYKKLPHTLSEHKQVPSSVAQFLIDIFSLLNFNRYVQMAETQNKVGLK